MKNDAPGPRGLPLSGSAIMFRRDPICFIQKCIAHYGDVSRVRLGPYKYHIINSPSLAKEVLKDRHRFTKRTRSIDLTKLICGENLITSDSDIWHRKRKLVQPLFHRKQLQNLIGTIEHNADKTIERWSQKEVVDLTRETLDITYDITTQWLFSADLQTKKSQIKQAVDGLLDTTAKRISSIIPPVLPTPRNLRFSKQKQFLYETIDELINQRLDKSSGYDLLQLLLKQEGLDSTAHRQEVIEEAITFLMAGHETSASALCWTLHFLSQNQEVQERVREEALVGNHEPLSPDSLTFTKAVVKESLRLRPPIWIIERHVQEESYLGGYRIPASSSIVLPVYSMHRHESYWNNPQTFNPDRFLTQEDHVAYLPFGAGARSCIGSQLAMQEVTILVARLVAKFSLSSTVLSPRFSPGLTLRPAEKVLLSVSSL